MLSDKQVSKFQELYLSRFGKEIGMEEAREKGAALVRFLKIVLKPMTEEEFHMLQKYRSRSSNN
jgi:hypothetical protein